MDKEDIESEALTSRVDYALQRQKLRVGIAGTGRAFFDSHLPAFRQLADFYKIEAVCDLCKDRRDKVEAEYPEVFTYRRVEDMLDNKDIDLILCSLPSAEHVSCALESLRREKYTVVEAPVAATHEDAKILQAASVKARGKLFAYTPGIFSPEFRMLQALSDDSRLGEIFEVRIRKTDYLRRDDWQSVKRCLGGCAFSDGQDVLLQAMHIIRSQPSQLWSELKRVASVGDAEDYAHIVLKSRGNVSVDIEICGAQLPPREPQFTIRGERGTFSIDAGGRMGMLHVIDPGFKFPRRRSSVRIPPLEDMHEDFPISDIPVPFFGNVEPGNVAFWRALYSTIRTAAPFPVPLDEVVEVVRYLQLVKLNSAFAVTK